MRRPRLVVLVAAAVVFVAVSAFLARWLGTEGTEREAIVALVAAQARGDASAVLATLDPACRRDADCARTARENARRLARPGAAKILNLRSETSYALTDAEGLTRVAWTVLDSDITVVQCVTVRRDGNAAAGHSITLLSVSAPIGAEDSCE